MCWWRLFLVRTVKVGKNEPRRAACQQVVPEAVRKRPTPQSGFVTSSARVGKGQSAASTSRDAIASDCDVAPLTNKPAR